MPSDDHGEHDRFEIERMAKHVADLHHMVTEDFGSELIARDVTAEGGMKELDPHVRLRVTVEFDRLDATTDDADPDAGGDSA